MNGEPDLDTVDFFWAKTDGSGRPALSVRDHCLNVGAVAEEIRRGLGDSARLLCDESLTVLIAAHDVGKISAGFLVKCPAWLEENGLVPRAQNFAWLKSESNHAAVSQDFVWSRLNRTRARKWAVAVGGHHGRFLGKAKVARTEVEKAWATREREKLFDELIKVFGDASTSGPESETQLLVVTGWMTVADWLGSNEAFFPLHREYDPATSRDFAAKALEAIRWGRGELRGGMEFSALFDAQDGNGFSANGLQRVALEQACRPGLHVIEAPMGQGKTEAALAVAHGLIAAGHHHGIYFALPTQLTSNRVHERVEAFLRNTLTKETDHPLAHSGSWLQRELKIHLRPAARAADETEGLEHVREGRSWFASSRQALLARHGVGTIDQALLAIVAAKYCAVRMFGLAGKVVILDEVHSYDAYMSALIDRLIERLLEAKCSVIVLSATLTRARRLELLRAAGAMDVEAVTEYPLVSSVGEGGRVISGSVGVSEEDRPEVGVSFRADEERALEEAGEAAEAGACVLVIRNTVAAAQETYGLMKSLRREGGPEVGLLHSRFPQFARDANEARWMTALGKSSTDRPRGCVLVATQVVEQSVDIDADLLITDLAPTDMLLQRVGRLWRHRRDRRPVARAEVRILGGETPVAGDAKALARGLGASARVYPPYVLLRSAAVWRQRESISLPDDIRDLLETTYAPPAVAEPPGWTQLREEMEARVARMKNVAFNRADIFGNVGLKDEEGVQTRWNDFPTANLVLLTREPEAVSTSEWRLSFAAGGEETASVFEWRFPVAATLHRSLVRVPLYAVRGALGGAAAPEWLRLHAHGATIYGVIHPDTGRIDVPDQGGAMELDYHPETGVRLTRQAASDANARPWEEDDDESWF